MSAGEADTLADLRELLLDDEVRLAVFASGGLAIVDEDDEDGRGERVVTVPLEVCERALRGDFDHLPTSTPIEELEGVGHHHHTPGGYAS